MYLNCDCVEYLKTCHFSTRPSSAGSAGSSSRKISRPSNEDVYVGKYKLMKTIGKGNFAKVKLAKHMPTGQEVVYMYVQCVSVFMSVCVCVCVCVRVHVYVCKH